MPYITKDIREQLMMRPPVTSGELSYCISQGIRRFMEATPNFSFDGGISKVYGALEAARVAFEQEVVIPYERMKKEQNGPVF